MTLRKSVQTAINEPLILRINELYHDLENDLYEERHQQMFDEVKKRWIRIATQYMDRKDPITCLDYGSGTGLVPTTIGSSLKKEDTLICMDISSAILEVCQENLAKVSTVCTVNFIKTTGKEIPLAAESVDCITMNSVLHHIFDPSFFAAECFRILKKDGFLCILNEPNGDTHLPFFERVRVAFTDLITQPSLLIYAIVEGFPVLGNMLRTVFAKINKTYRKRNDMLNQIAEQLMSENLISLRLTGSEIQQLVDIQTQFGFNKSHVVNTIFKSFRLMEWTTFSYCHQNIGIAQKHNQWLSKRYPLKGRILGFIFQK